MSVGIWRNIFNSAQRAKWAFRGFMLLMIATMTLFRPIMNMKFFGWEGVLWWLQSVILLLFLIDFWRNKI